MDTNKSREHYKIRVRTWYTQHLHDILEPSTDCGAGVIKQSLLSMATIAVLVLHARLSMMHTLSNGRGSPMPSVPHTGTDFGHAAVLHFICGKTESVSWVCVLSV